MVVLQHEGSEGPRTSERQTRNFLFIKSTPRLTKLGLSFTARYFSLRPDHVLRQAAAGPDPSWVSGGEEEEEEEAQPAAASSQPFSLNKHLETKVE